MNHKNIITSGVFLKGNDARIISLSGNRNNHSLVTPKFHKLQLIKNPSQDDVEVFKKAFLSYCSDNNIKIIIINKRTVNGKGAGGSMSFIIEGVLLAIAEIPIKSVHTATIRATDKREIQKKSIKPKTVALGKAYDLAYEGLY